MAHDKAKVAKCKAHFVQGMPLANAAEAAGVSYPTARNWKRKAGELGDDWDVARNARRLSRGSIEALTTELLERISHTVEATLKDIESKPDMDAVTKSEILVRVSDSYVKTLAAAGRANPRLARLSITMDVLKAMLGFVAEHYPAQRAWFVEVIERFGAEAAQGVGSE